MQIVFFYSALIKQLIVAITYYNKLPSTDSLLLSNLYHLFMYVDRNDIWFSSLDKNLFVFSNIHEIKEFIANRFSCICSEHYEC